MKTGKETKTKLVKDLEVGDVVFRESDGERLTIVSIEKGWLADSKALHYRGGDWTCLPNNRAVEVESR